MIQDLVGKRFGRLVVLSFHGKDKFNKPLWKCRYDCGVERIIVYQSLLRGLTKSCGCLQKDIARKRITTHNLTGHPVFNLWRNLKARCCNPNIREFKDYGGRGIKVCDEWLNDFQAFYNWAMNNGWKKGVEIDRRNNDGNYEPGNCRFVTRKKNNQNTRRSYFWIINDNKYKSLSEAAKAEKVSIMTICHWCGTVGNYKGKIKQKPGCYAVPKYPKLEK